MFEQVRGSIFGGSAYSTVCIKSHCARVHSWLYNFSPSKLFDVKDSVPTYFPLSKSTMVIESKWDSMIMVGFASQEAQQLTTCTPPSTARVLRRTWRWLRRQVMSHLLAEPLARHFVIRDPWQLVSLSEFYTCSCCLWSTTSKTWNDALQTKWLHQVAPFYSDKELSFLPTVLPTDHIAKTTGSDTEEETANITSRSSWKRSRMALCLKRPYRSFALLYL
jgi:hypothetical protein